MTSKKSNPEDPSEPIAGTGWDMRRRAEEQAGETGADSTAALSPQEARRLVHELRVHQIELEMQNEELRRTQMTLEVEQARFLELYDLAPVGFFTLDSAGVILESNLTAATMLGLSKESLAGQRLTHFIDPQDQDTYYLHQKQLFTTGQRQMFDLRLRSNRHNVDWWGRVETILVLNEENGTKTCRAVVSDITGRKQAELELEHEHSLLKALLDTSPDSIYFKDTQLRFVRASRATALREGIPQPELMLGKTDFDFFDRATAQAFYDLEMEIMRGGHPVINQEFKGQRPGQPPRWFLVTELPLRDAAGQVSGVYAISREITDRKQAELELERERSLLKALLDNIPDSIYFKDTQLRFLRVSRATALKEGLQQPEQMLGKTDFDFYDRESAQEFYDLEMEIMRTGQPVVDLEQKEQRPGQPPTWASSTEAPLRDAAGQVIGVFGITRDITARKQAELELEHERDLMKALMDTSPDGIYFKDSQLRFVRVSRATALKEGLQQPELMIGKTDFDLYDRETAQAFYDLEMEIMRTGQPVVDLEQKEQRPGQPPTWALSTKMPLRDVDGQVIGLFGISRDITERKQAEQALRDSEARFRALIEQAPVAIYALAGWDQPVFQ